MNSERYAPGLPALPASTTERRAEVFTVLSPDKMKEDSEEDSGSDYTEGSSVWQAGFLGLKHEHRFALGRRQDRRSAAGGPMTRRGQKMRADARAQPRPAA